MALLKALRSSGDYLADRRFAYAQAAAAEGDDQAAEDLVLQTLELVPDFAPAWFTLGELREKQGLRDQAIEAFERARACDETDELGAVLHLGRLGAIVPQTASPRFVESLFDHYADDFEAHLTQKLHYRGPSLLAEAYMRLQAGVAETMIDLGCGTGLAGEAFRPMARHLTGVDLSPRMIEAAKARGLYDRLAVAAVEDFLMSEPESSVDLIIAADVFVYMGDLSSVLAGSRRVLKPDGLLGFTVQVTQTKPYKVGHDLRFAHAEAYLRAALAEARLHLTLCEDVSTRQEAGTPVPGLLIIARA
ncbi:class I SAM-dependent DNA methyltransferase [Beijerinckia indica]|uniref:Methyltransferase type 12 n=1 Tax=Beijerinckia indica subsp. indica (strain ATCC 9039 / DSM 1715 / NCIMB 8712) TaxID=395963 RepID=B2IIM5_BEII9|nr:methyltransferase domain-containing protein [Beijerinckia indica]ACB94718.1 Methyltransferase type 12 [Beijerinckia indica subsp. indica ATCC 9039]